MTRPFKLRALLIPGRMGHCLLYVILIFLVAATWAVAQNGSANFPASWLDALRADARKRGISTHTLDAVLQDIKPIPRVIELDRRQPEGRLTFAEYLNLVVPPSRVQRGRNLLAQHKALLDDVSAKYGVPASVIVALWGVESDYGRRTGGFPVIGALATLAYDGRRGAYFRGELLNALQILQEGHITPAQMTGSWAGAMGQSQFMPSSFLSRAVDHDGDGRRDIWTTHADVFASAANYLKRAGWRKGQLWGRRVILPPDFDADLISLKVVKQLADWQALGVRNAKGQALPKAAFPASVVAPDGPEGQTFIVYHNFRVFLKWNRSTYFGTAVGLLSDQIGTP
ncbi:MAG: lytic transglycosylase [Candidatus Entotheonella factor]|uniref:Lytic transglycosylase n=1 Tax=Entotheonella factor TaxID=1429438 RepID=W4LHV7_ENTF1|nr:MAG: lytic transglycosylase [Candidatus Entotheonella factor]